ncbi:hypothetical protein N8D55_19415 [Xanthomonas hortorum pv. pelargonii]|nr:hypothetical protein N8D55_19415 [Xanthomonas hortorum pv. pelargonii]
MSDGNELKIKAARLAALAIRSGSPCTSAWAWAVSWAYCSGLLPVSEEVANMVEV